MIPICLVTGFLGSGKTTLLQRIADTHRDWRLTYIVNEFSSLDVDGARLELPEDELVPIPGGSIFCRCKVEDFLTVLRQMAARDPFPEGVVIEATGIADPQVVAKMLEETGLTQSYALATVVSVVEPGKFPKLVHTLPNVVTQVKVADVVLLNMTDRFDAEAVSTARDLIASINSDATVFETVRCNAEFPLFGNADRERSLGGEYAACADPNYTQGRIEFNDAVEWDKLKAAIDSMAGRLYRVKGNVPTREGVLAADFSSSGWNVDPARNAQAEPGLVLIGDHAAGCRLDDLARRTASGEFSV